MKEQLTPHLLSNPMEFLLGGKAIFTIRNNNSGNHLTYRVIKSGDKDIFFVSALTGPDNGHSYSYLGMITENRAFIQTRGSKIAATATTFRVFEQLWTRIVGGGKLPPTIQLYHEGRCGRCGHTLTDPASIERGFGPICVDLVGRGI